MLGATSGKNKANAARTTLRIRMLESRTHSVHSLNKPNKKKYAHLCALSAVTTDEGSRQGYLHCSDVVKKAKENTRKAKP